MRTLQQSQQCCTPRQQIWHRPAVAQARSGPPRRSVTASASGGKAKVTIKIGKSKGASDCPAPQLPVVFQIPKPARSLQSVLAAQAAAEAAQQELLATGPLAEAAAAGNELVSSILSTYSTVQRLYHKAVLPFLERHPQYIDSFAGEVFLDSLGQTHLNCPCCAMTSCAAVLAPVTGSYCQLRLRLI
jgi:hypothetical protein